MDRGHLEFILQERLAEAKRLLDEAKEIAEKLNVPIHFIGAIWEDDSWILYERPRFVRPKRFVEWSESNHCIEYDWGPHDLHPKFDVGSPDASDQGSGEGPAGDPATDL